MLCSIKNINMLKILKNKQNYGKNVRTVMKTKAVKCLLTKSAGKKIAWWSLKTKRFATQKSENTTFGMLLLDFFQ